jgi:hypothetical protein
MRAGAFAIMEYLFSTRHGPSLVHYMLPNVHHRIPQAARDYEESERFAESICPYQARSEHTVG